MAQLVPCPQCGRHVRLSSPHCPFCDVALDVSGLSEQYVARRVIAPAGIKRAAMFALGAGVVAACSGEPPLEGPIYGAPVAPTSDESTSGTSSASQTSASDTTSPPIFDPDAGQIQPLYGAPTFDGTSTSGEPDASFAGDAGAHDAGSIDAAIPDLPTLDPIEPNPNHLYGAPPLPLDDAPRR